MSRVDDYLDALRAELAKLGLDDNRFVIEARDHLVDAIQTEVSNGRPVADAERDALERFGAPQEVVADLDHRRRPALNQLLAALSAAAIASTLWLSGSLLILRPPHTGRSGWWLWAAAVAAHGVLTLKTISGEMPGYGRVLLIGGASALLLASAWQARTILLRAHFDGSWLIFTAIVVTQSALTLIVLARDGTRSDRCVTARRL
jgi:hypothetical protein